ncbi:MAG: chemotaxis-specific protein-glutamate methyltransferase CheB, partial [Planctomycetota bacterium]
MSDPVRVLIVDDSLLVRTALEQGLSSVPGISVVGTAADPYQARDMLVRLRPQVMTLDIEMPRMDGLTFLRRLLPQWPIPVIMVSSLTERGADSTLQALAIGAVDFIAKPTASISGSLHAMIGELAEKIRAASTITHLPVEPVCMTKDVRPQSQAASSLLTPALSRRLQAIAPPKLIAIGASTGGTQALHTILSVLPSDMPPIVAVQHMPPAFTTMFAQRLDATCKLRVREARDGDEIANGDVLIAPGGQQMRIIGNGGRLRVRISEDGLVNGHQPSVEPLFVSCVPIARWVTA